MNLIFSKHYKRKLSKNLSLQYNNTTYQVNIKNIGYAMRGSTITICETFDGKITLLYKGKPESQLQTKTRPPVVKINDQKEGISTLR